MISFRPLFALAVGLCVVGASYLTLPAREPVKAPPPARKRPVDLPIPEPEVVGGWVPAAAYSRDGRLIALARSDTRSLVLYDPSTWQRLHTFEGMTELSHAVVFSADGDMVYAASYDGRIFTWDTRTGKAGPILDAKAGPCTGLVLSPDGKVLASGHHDTGDSKTSIHLWDVKTSREIRTITGDDPLLPNSIAFSPDGRVIAGGYHATHKDPKDVGGFHGVIEWEVKTGKEVKRYEIPRVTPGATPITHTIAYSSDAKQVIVGGGEAVPIPGGGGCHCVGCLWVCRRDTGDVKQTLIANNRSDYVRMVTLSADGKKLFVPTHTPYRRVMRNGQFTEMSFSSLQCWDTETWELDWSVESEPTTVSAIAVDPNGKRVGVSDTTGFRLLDAGSGETKGELIRVKR